MLSSQDEACKFLVRSEMISYHSVNGNSFFFSNNFARRRPGKVSLLITTSLYNLSQNSCFFPAEKILGMLMWRVILVILGLFGHAS